VAPHAAVVLLAALVVAVCSQRWTGTLLDGQFYASLSLFGHHVTDRAIFTSYYWTRLGVIAPLGVLTHVLGTWLGFTVYRFLLITGMVWAFYAIALRYVRWQVAAALTLFVSLNSVILTYFGNTYLTGAVMTGMTALLATALARSSDARPTAIGAGVLLSWLVMSNPPGFLLAAVTWLVLRVLRRSPLATYAWTALGAAVTFAVFLLAGKVLFPAMNWFAVYAGSNAIHWSDFASKSPIWPHDISLLVPVMALLISISVWWTRHQSAPAQYGFAIASSSIAFMLVFNPMMGGIPLEAPMYQAMLFPPAMAALLLSACAVIGNRTWTWQASLALVIGFVAILALGHWTHALTLHRGWALGAVLVIVAALLLTWQRTAVSMPMVLLVIAAVLCGAQVLQNSRGDLGLYYQSRYSAAFIANGTSSKMHASVNAESWLLAHTTDHDKILGWVDGSWVTGDRELYMVAGMQLWGLNRIGISDHLESSDVAELESLKPTALALYGPSAVRIDAFVQALPAQSHPTAPICYDFPWPDPTIPVGHACLTHLIWTS